jgi:signal recognition particle receptor subunit beta
MLNQKIIFAGTPCADVSNALATLSDTPISKIALAAASLDFGQVNLEDDVSIDLYGISWHEFDFNSLDALTDGGIGLVLLIDNSSPQPFIDLRSLVKTFRSFIDQNTLVIGITKTDTHPAPFIEDYHQELKPLGLVSTPVFEVDTGNRKDISLLVEALLCSVEPVI